MNKQTKNTTESIDVIGIGNAIVDVLVQTTDDFIESKALKKSNMTLINESEAEEIYKEMGEGLETSGGSAANTLAGISELGGKTAFIGRVNNDKLGKIFTKEIQATGTIFQTEPTTKGPSTARCLILVTPDAERTMCTYLGASTFLEPKDLDLSIIKNTKILYLEGYLFDSEAAKKAFYKAAKFAKVSNKKVALSLSDSFCVDRHRESFLDLLENHVDILFSNESELISLYESNSLLEALEKASSACETVVTTLGEKGSIILNKKEKLEIKSFKLGKTIDTTGAGDLYASGFLYGYINNYNLKKCGEIASLCAGHIVTQLGPRANISLQSLIKDNL